MGDFYGIDGNQDRWPKSEFLYTDAKDGEYIPFLKKVTAQM